MENQTASRSTQETFTHCAGRHKFREILYAHILLRAAKGRMGANIVVAYATSTKTVQRTRQRFVEAGLHTALTKEPRPGQPPKLTPEQEILLITLSMGSDNLN